MLAAAKGCAAASHRRARAGRGKSPGPKHLLHVPRALAPRGDGCAPAEEQPVEGGVALRAERPGVSPGVTVAGAPLAGECRAAVPGVSAAQAPTRIASTRSCTRRRVRGREFAS
jgi:hypothetical protein